MALAAGERHTVSHQFSQTDFDRFAALSGDDNPIHVDPAFAAGTPFGRTVAHGMLLYSVLRRFLGEWLPAHREIEQDLRFEAPTFAGEALTFEFELVEVTPSTITVRTDLRKPDGRYGCRGNAQLGLEKAVGSVTRAEGPAQPFAGSAGLPGRLSLGAQAGLVRAFTPEDIAAYKALTGNSQAGAGRVPGPLLGGLISNLLGTRLPGPGTNWLKQRFRYLQEVSPGEPVGAGVEIVRLRPEKGLVNLRTVCVNGAGETVCDGAALVLYRNANADAI